MLRIVQSHALLHPFRHDPCQPASSSAELNDIAIVQKHISSKALKGCSYVALVVLAVGQLLIMLPMALRMGSGRELAVLPRCFG